MKEHIQVSFSNDRLLEIKELTVDTIDTGNLLDIDIIEWINETVREDFRFYVISIHGHENHFYDNGQGLYPFDIDAGLILRGSDVVIEFE